MVGFTGFGTLGGGDLTLEAGRNAASAIRWATSWWVNFGTYTNVSAAAGGSPRMVGFTGFGTLGGGDLTLEAGRNA
ncbi:hypothetical protein C7E18_23085, partial [Stenotrophomonas maltophilia]